MFDQPTVTPGVREVCDDLARRDPDLASVLQAIGYPPIVTRPRGFPTLLLLILEQQVSIASARATYLRVERALGVVTPDAFLTLTPDVLRNLGFSRQKARYGYALAAAIVAGSLDLHGLDKLDDDDARTALIALPGIGPWTADVYLLMVLGRPDVWPSGDVALQTAAQTAKALASRPSASELGSLAEPWRPHRSMAAHLLWHLYLSAPRRALR